MEQLFYKARQHFCSCKNNCSTAPKDIARTLICLGEYSRQFVRKRRAHGNLQERISLENTRAMPSISGGLARATEALINLPFKTINVQI